ncbi:uncharacterized protein TNCV_2462121 [Trichonephila clavipes]|nr:uncharacterized protein TNCV_2462121 [Trichonephila clavipes]
MMAQLWLAFIVKTFLKGSLAASLSATNFDTEIESVRLSICHLINLSTSYRRIIFLVDFQSAILTLCFLHNSDSIEVKEPSRSLSCRQSFSNISRFVGKYIRQIQENDARGKIWETLLHSPVPMGHSRQVFSAVFRTLPGHDFLQQHLHRIGVKNTTDCPLCLCGEVMNFIHLTVCASLDNTGFKLSSDNFTAKAVLYWADRREMAYTAHSSAFVLRLAQLFLLSSNQNSAVLRFRRKDYGSEWKRKLDISQKQLQ